MSGSGGAKRRLKRMKREGDESQSIVEQLMGLFMAHNITVNFPWEIPNIVGQMLAQGKQGGGPPSHQQAVIQANASLDRLKQLTGKPPGTPVRQERTRAIQSTGEAYSDPWNDLDESAPPPPVDPWGAAAEESLEEFREEDVDPYAFHPDNDDGEDEDDLNHDEMLRRFEAGQARMMNRVATNGVQYKHGANGPAAGQRIAPAPEVAKNMSEQPIETPVSAPSPSTGGGKRGMNGLTTEEARQIISRATGREIKVPGGNPTAKPAGM